jgi:dihydrofolate reductase
MGKVIVINHLTLDGVMQGPGRSDEDTRDGFAHGGWAAANNDDAMFQAISKVTANAGPMLFGRWTYESFYESWPTRRPGDRFTTSLTAAHKYVASTTLDEPLVWENSSLLSGDVAQAVTKLKAEHAKDFLVFGSGGLIQTLARHNLVDTYLLLIHPLVLGTGRRLFPDGGVPAKLRLVEATTTTTGVIAATYESVEGEG